MKLYIANCTQQTFMCNYRLIESPRPHAQPITAGGQIIVAKPDLNLPQIEDIIRQLRKYGLLTLEEASQLRRSDPPCTLACSIDKVISVETIQKIMLHNQGVLFLNGKRFREEAAIATSNQLGEMNRTAGETLEMTIQEEKPGSGDHSGVAPINEGLRIDTGKPRESAPRGRGKRGG